MDEKNISKFHAFQSDEDKPRYYFELIPRNKNYIIKKNFAYDRDAKLYYSHNPEDVQDYKIKYIDLFYLADELEIKYDKEKKRWYTFKSNDKIDDKFYE